LYIAKGKYKFKTSEMLEQLGLFSKKYLFSTLLIIVGLALVIVALTPNEAVQRTQSSWFLFGGSAILIAGIVSLLYALELISRMVHFAVMIVLFVFCGILTVLSIKSLQETIEKREAKEKYDDDVKQSLDDIRTVQLAYKKVYGMYATDFTELNRFLVEDQVYRTIPVVLHESGQIPDRQPKGWELDTLGYDPFEDEALIKDGIDEEEAIKLGYFRVDTVWVPVMEDLFFSEEAMKNASLREFDFDPNLLSVIRNTGEEKHLFQLVTKELDSATNAMLVIDTYAFNPFKEDGQPRDTMKLGSLDLSDESTNGSWEQ
jgi:Ca2+/Na+ antiporter